MRQLRDTGSRKTKRNGVKKMVINKFEIGDKVQTVGDYLNEWSGGKTFTITNWCIDINGDCLYAIDCAGGPAFPWMYEHWLKRVA